MKTTTHQNTNVIFFKHTVQHTKNDDFASMKIRWLKHTYHQTVINQKESIILRLDLSDFFFSIRS